jgi:hypothetical protein
MSSPLESGNRCGRDDSRSPATTPWNGLGRGEKKGARFCQRYAPAAAVVARYRKGKEVGCEPPASTTAQRTGIAEHEQMVDLFGRFLRRRQFEIKRRRHQVT